MRLELRERTFLIDAHEAAVASHVGCQDGCKPSFYALGDQRLPSGIGPGQLTPPLIIEPRTRQLPSSPSAGECPEGVKDGGRNMSAMSPLAPR